MPEKQKGRLIVNDELVVLEFAARVLCKQRFAVDVTTNGDRR
jgi:hypothetical protein